MLKYVLLSLLLDGADHGYRLKQRLDAHLGPVWHVNVGQVYQVLDRLRRCGWVEELPPETARGGGHERWPVVLTARGRTELARWLDEPIPPTRPPGPVRNEILGRLAVGGRSCTQRVLDGLLAERSTYLSEYEGLTLRCAGLPEPGSEIESAQLLALQASRLAMRAHLEWLDLCFAHLSAADYERRARTTRQSSICAPSSTTRLGGMPK